jgi:hypothetical protein
MLAYQHCAEKGNCFQLKADFCIFLFSSVLSVPKEGKTEAAAGRCASFASIVVHKMIKQAGSFIPLHL